VLAILFVAIAWLLVTVTDMKRKIYNTVPRDCWRAKKKKKKNWAAFVEQTNTLYTWKIVFLKVSHRCVDLSGPCIKSNVSLPLATNSLPIPHLPARHFRLIPFPFFLLPASCEQQQRLGCGAHESNTHTNEYCIWRAPWSPNVAESFFGERKKQEPIGHHTISLIPHLASVVNNQIEIERLTCHRNDVMYIQINYVQRYNTQYGTDQITWNWN
jgi:hypothetical protein